MVDFRRLEWLWEKRMLPPWTRLRKWAMLFSGTLASSSLQESGQEARKAPSTLKTRWRASVERAPCPAGSNIQVGLSCCGGVLPDGESCSTRQDGDCSNPIQKNLCFSRIPLERLPQWERKPGRIMYQGKKVYILPEKGIWK